ncbi:MAG: hypothetical protein JW828_11770 [Sedimentisphaerales bacterium]|nr:hypothetical protein [Sedimentisphaerales bacterium]
MEQSFEAKEIQPIKWDSPRLWIVRIFKLSTILLSVLLFIVILHALGNYRRRLGCAINLYGLDSALPVYTNDFEGKLPQAKTWNDLLITYADVDVSAFHCPGSHSAGNTSDYAINAALYTPGKSASGDTVQFFECIAGWNQTGGLDLFYTGNHGNKIGCYNSVRVPEGQFISAEKVGQLKWE